MRTPYSSSSTISLGDDDPPTTTEDLDVAPALGAESIDEVLEVLEVAALVRANGHALNVLGDCRRDHFIDGSVVAEVDDLGPLRLQEPAHDVDGRVVTVEETGGRDEAHRVYRIVEFWRRNARVRRRRSHD